MAQKVLLQLEAAEKVVVADLRIALLLAQAKVNEVKARCEAEFKAAVDDVSVKANNFNAKLKSIAVETKVDCAQLEFDIDKYFFYVRTEVTAKVEDAVKAADSAITAEIKKFEVAVKSEEKGIVADAEKLAVEAVAEVKKVL